MLFKLFFVFIFFWIFLGIEVYFKMFLLSVVLVGVKIIVIKVDWKSDNLEKKNNLLVIFNISVIGKVINSNRLGYWKLCFNIGSFDFVVLVNKKIFRVNLIKGKMLLSLVLFNLNLFGKK